MMAMKFYWSGNLPELEGLSKRHRKAARDFAWGYRGRHWQFWLGLLLWVLCIGLGRAVSQAVLGFPVAGVAIGTGIGWFLHHQLSMRALERYYRRYLDFIDHCPSCGYDLKRSSSGVCPECGTSHTHDTPEIEMLLDAEEIGPGVLRFIATDAWLAASWDERFAALNRSYVQWEDAADNKRPRAICVRDTSGQVLWWQPVYKDVPFLPADGRQVFDRTRAGQRG